MAQTMTRIIILMGVSGSGKTTVGRRLAAELGWLFYDGDELHPAQNVTKMAQGTPLNDDDRRPWLARLNRLIADHQERGLPTVFACSALKKAYRDTLRRDNRDLVFVHLQGDYETIFGRLQERQSHYMKSNMLESQFEDLKPISPDEGFSIDVDLDPGEITKQILQKLGLEPLP